tara:strand:+ start:437 stop:1099 length:663 start_codon:yes stop_codon:yes gene_type:complete
MSKVIVFDLDDTLYPEKDYVRSGFRAVDVYLNGLEVAGFFDVAWSYFCGGGRGNTFDHCLAQLGVASDAELVGKLVAVYRDHEPTLSLFEDAHRALQKLSGHERLGLITDGASASQHRKIRALGLGEALHKIVVTDDLGGDRSRWKPHPLAYEMVREHFMVSHSECLYVGDNESKDFVTAKGLGWQTICVRRPGGEYSDVEVDDAHRAELTISSLDEMVF